MKLGDIAQRIGAQRPCDAALAQVEPRGFSIDSRTIQPSEVFFALRGSSHDGHQFVASALAKGACAAVVSPQSSHLNVQPDDPRLLLVEDPLTALQTLARAVRAQWGGPVIGITGSAGKTATKELTARVLASGGARVVKSKGNYNNAYGLPLSVLQLISADTRPEEVEYLVLEMGMSAPGEIAHLCSIASPDVGVVTLVAAAHLGFFPNLEAIAEAKAELVDGVKEGGVVILNLDDPRVARMRFRRLIEVRTFGLNEPATVRATEVHLRGLEGSRFTLHTPRGQVAVELPLIGRHNIYNALAAATVADYYGVPLERIAQGLSEAAPVPQRGEVIRFPQGFIVINDVYNSNPQALKEMVATVCAIDSVKRRIMVLGEMLELGEAAPELHRACGRQIAHGGVDMLIGVRGLAREFVTGARQAAMPPEATYFCETPEAAARLLFDNLQAGDLVLVKGSRAVQMERVIAELRRLSGEDE